MQALPDIRNYTSEQVRELLGQVHQRMREDAGIPGPPPGPPPTAPDTLSGPTGPPDDETIQIDHEEDDQWGAQGSEHVEELQGPHPPHGPPPPSGTLMVPMPKWTARRQMPGPAQRLMALQGPPVPRGRPHGSPHGSPCQSPRSRSAYGDNEQQRWLHRGSQDHYAARLEQDRGAIQPGPAGSPSSKGQPLKSLGRLAHLPTTARLGSPGSSTSTKRRCLPAPLQSVRRPARTSKRSSGSSSRTASRVPR